MAGLKVEITFYQMQLAVGHTPLKKPEPIRLLNAKQRQELPFVRLVTSCRVLPADSSFYVGLASDTFRLFLIKGNHVRQRFDLF
jgi:hypothetical protein